MKNPFRVTLLLSFLFCLTVASHAGNVPPGIKTEFNIEAFHPSDAWASATVVVINTPVDNSGNILLTASIISFTELNKIGSEVWCTHWCTNTQAYVITNYKSAIKESKFPELTATLPCNSYLFEKPEYSYRWKIGEPTGQIHEGELYTSNQFRHTGHACLCSMTKC